jgi:hypothetical protein
MVEALIAPVKPTQVASALAPAHCAVTTGKYITGDEFRLPAQEHERPRVSVDVP